MSIPEINDDLLMSDATTRIADNLDADLFIYAGDITPQGYELVSETLEHRAEAGTKRKNAALFLNTFGGDAHAAYRIARAFGHHYCTLTLLVFGDCKSAGTLLALGFNKLIIGDRGELGPMDVQMASKEELYEYNSGLDMIQAMDFMQRHAKDAFHGFLRDIRVTTRLGTKSAGEMARQLTQGLFTGMYSQLDPVRLGNVQRTMRITHAYGKRLNERSQILRSPEELQELVYRYPSHGFVIDRKEARTTLFAKDVVRAPNKLEDFIGKVMYRELPADQKGDPVFLHLTDLLADAKSACQDEQTVATEPAKPLAAEEVEIATQGA